jgi:hypothetical protein
VVIADKGKSGVGVGFYHAGDEADQRGIPIVVVLADGGMIIFQEAPDLAEVDELVEFLRGIVSVECVGCLLEVGNG